MARKKRRLRKEIIALPILFAAGFFAVPFCRSGIQAAEDYSRNSGYVDYTKNHGGLVVQMQQRLIDRTLGDPDGKYIHYSIDDVWNCLNDLIQKESVYSSIFDNPYFARLKEIHDQTGAVFTLNTFNRSVTDQSYNISNLPSKFAHEIQNNSSWLRFAFHGKDINSDYLKEDVNEDYKTFLDAMQKFTGGSTCIDRFTRLNYFQASLDSIKGLKTASVPIEGLLTSDDDRWNYYINYEEAAVIPENGKFIDTKHGLVFLKSAPRLDHCTAEELIKTLSTDSSFSNFSEVFFHEVSGIEQLDKIAQIAAWADSQGYVNAYPSDIFKNQSELLKILPMN
ncbi:MAG: hypothetical protein HUJ55_06000 [Ileibacterium sp.]|nr:hypothetical protein [Ileibacterium sp.]